MKEHALFIRILLDTSGNKLILAADRFANEYESILQNYTNNSTNLTTTSLRKTTNFRDFKIAGEEEILNCTIKSIIIPSLLDHVVR